MNLTQKTRNLNLRASGAVSRYHTWPTLKQQTVADHTWNVLRIYERLFGAPEPYIFQHILYHDAAEVITGDIPFEIKRKNKDFKDAYDEVEKSANEMLGLSRTLLGLAPLDAAKVKFCDLQEMAEFAIIEMEMGNRLARPIFDNIIKAQKALLEKDILVESNKDIALIMRNALYSAEPESAQQNFLITYSVGFDFGFPNTAKDS